MKVEVEYSRIVPRLDLLPLVALEEVGRVFGYGAIKHEEGSWWDVSMEEHINKALSHLHEREMGAGNGIDEDQMREDHLANACCRLMMALAQRGPQGVPAPGIERANYAPSGIVRCQNLEVPNQ